MNGETPYLQLLRLSSFPPEVRWRTMATAYRGEARPSTVRLAVKRLTRGEVTRTEQGLRVTEVDTGASYWPDSGCLCGRARRGVCSHQVATLVYQLWERRKECLHLTDFPPYGPAPATEYQQPRLVCDCWHCRDAQPVVAM